MLEKEYIVKVVKIEEDIVTVFSEDLDWEFQVPMDFFPDPLKLELQDSFSLKIQNFKENNYSEEEFGGYKKNAKKTKVNIH